MQLFADLVAGVHPEPPTGIADNSSPLDDLVLIRGRPISWCLNLGARGSQGDRYNQAAEPDDNHEGNYPRRSVHLGHSS